MAGARRCLCTAVQGSPGGLSRCRRRAPDPSGIGRCSRPSGWRRRKPPAGAHVFAPAGAGAVAVVAHRGVPAQAGDDREDVLVVGVDPHPAAGPPPPQRMKPGRVERRFEQAGGVQHVADRARAVIAARVPVAVAAAPAVGTVAGSGWPLRSSPSPRAGRRGRRDRPRAAGRQRRLRHRGRRRSACEREQRLSASRQQSAETRSRPRMKGSIGSWPRSARTSGHGPDGSRIKRRLRH